MANTYLSRTISSTSTPKKMTCSFWIKRTGSGNSVQRIFSQSNNAPFDMYWRWETGDVFTAWNELNNGGTLNSITPNMKFRDFGAWYHIVLRWDTTQSTSTDRIRMYVNGTNIDNLGGYSSYTAPSLNDDIGIFSSTSNIFDIGYYRANGGETLDSILSHVHVCDGYSYGPESFGSTDGTTGEWKINPSPNVSYGTNGFFLFKDNASVNDQSGNGNNFTLGSGNLNKTEDNPSNIFCTLNPLQEPGSGQAVEYTFGNTKFAGNWSHWQRAYGTIGANTGKFYYEFKCLNTSGTAGHLRVGWDSIDYINMESSGTSSYYSGLTLDKGGKLRGGIVGYNNYEPNDVQMTAAHSGGNFSFTTNDILGMAIDIDNETFSVYKNGNLEINAYSYAGLSNNSISKSRGHFISPSVNWYSASGNANRSCFNFGNGYFETTAVSSAGTNASNLGIFEYDVPTGYTAFCTKGLNE